MNKTNIDYPATIEEHQQGVEAHKYDVASKPYLSSKEKARRFADDMPANPAELVCPAVMHDDTWRC